MQASILFNEYFTLDRVVCRFNIPSYVTEFRGFWCGAGYVKHSNVPSGEGDGPNASRLPGLPTPLRLNWWCIITMKSHTLSLVLINAVLITQRTVQFWYDLAYWVDSYRSRVYWESDGQSFANYFDLGITIRSPVFSQEESIQFCSSRLCSDSQNWAWLNRLKNGLPYATILASLFSVYDSKD